MLNIANGAEKVKVDLSADDFRALLDYNPETGALVWRVNRGGRARSGSTAGAKNNNGYLQIRDHYDKYLTHRLAWMIVHGEFPPDGLEIDHINGVRETEFSPQYARAYARGCTFVQVSLESSASGSVISLIARSQLQTSMDSTSPAHPGSQTMSAVEATSAAGYVQQPGPEVASPEQKPGTSAAHRKPTVNKRCD